MMQQGPRSQWEMTDELVGEIADAGFNVVVPRSGGEDLQTVAQNSQGQQKQQLTTPPEHRLQTSLQTNPENGPKSVDSLPEDLAEIVDVWPELPEHIKAAIKALIQTNIQEKK